MRAQLKIRDDEISIVLFPDTRHGEVEVEEVRRRIAKKGSSQFHIYSSVGPGAVGIQLQIRD